jgi:ribonuclease PH
VVATGRGGIVEIQGTAEGEAVPRQEIDRMVDLALVGIEKLVAIQERVLADAGVELTRLMRD